MCIFAVIPIVSTVARSQFRRKKLVDEYIPENSQGADAFE
jgi:hypothetical protein